MTKNELPSGYEFHFDESFFGGRSRVIVPSSLRFERDAEAAKKAADEAVKDAEERAAEKNDDGWGVARKKLDERETKPSPKLVWAEIGVADLEYAWDKRRLKIFNCEAAVPLASSHGEESESKRLQDIYDDLTKRGTTLRAVARPGSLDPLRELAARQPHMAEVVNFVIRQLVLADHSRVPVRLQPMLLLGEPGAGKTYFCQALATALETTIRIERMDSDLTNSFLTGSDKKWSNTQHGALFEALVRGENANPVFLLDELDKAQRTRYGSPVDALYSVLEPLSAKCVRDISLEFEFDASLVTWIATANDARLIPEPLRSRFREFHILPPSAEEALVLAYGVIDETIQNSGMPDLTFDRRICRYVAHFPARRIFQLTLDAVAKVVAEGRSRLEKRDLPAELLDDSSEEPARNRLH